MRNLYRSIWIFLLLICCEDYLCQSTSQPAYHTINGTIQDTASGEYLVGALVAAPEKGIGTSSNLYGFYSLTLPAGKHTLRFSLLGYETQELTIDLTKDLRFDRSMTSQVIQAGEVTIQGDKEDNTRSTDIGKIGLEMDQVKTLPVLLGEIDILKPLHFYRELKAAGKAMPGFMCAEEVLIKI